ncbi:MAG: M28 family peptidase [Flavobacteriaceae bacterium]|nr:M28 family peptidase [Flavobacteriaceae bacterium]
MKKVSLLIIFISLFGCKEEYKPENKIKEDVSFLADDKLEGRQTGTEGEKKAADYISKRFKELGLEPKGTANFLQPFSFKPKSHPHEEVKFTENIDGTITGNNIIGYLDNKADKTIIIGAHYDHLGYGGEGSLYRGEEKQIHNGADDNASGIAVLLNLASKLKNKNTQNNYLFMAFSAEEMGLLGSNYFVKNPTIDLKSVNYMVNMDMVGRLKKDSALAVYGVGTSPIFKKTLEEDPKNKFRLVLKESGVGPSDHTSFYLADIPVLHFFTGQHEDYHKPTDDTDLLNYEGMNLISEYLFAIISDLDDDAKLTFTKTKNETKKGAGFKVTLGVVPDYLFDGKGMQISGVTEEKSAHKAGIKKGDVVVKMGDIEVNSMMDYVKSLSKFEKGATIKVIIIRDGKEVALNVTF